MTCVVLLELEVKEEAVEGLMAGLKDIFPDTRAYEGCIDVYASQDQDKPTTIVMVERWESRAHYEKYFAWRTDRGDIENMSQALSGPPSIRYFDPIGA